MKILIAEDDPVSQRLLVRTLEKWGYEVVAVDDGQAALDILLDESKCPDLAILDWMMPKMDGVRVCSRLRNALLDRFVFVILLSGKDAKKDVVQGLEAGADDYLSKPYDPEELRSRIRAGERIVRLQTALQAANVELKRLAHEDALTGMLNRHAIMERLSEELQRTVRNETPLAIILADVDHFKLVNDQYGHVAGDHVLREFALRLRKGLRAFDVLGRYGGEEFLILMPGVPGYSCHNVTERLRLDIANKPFLADGNTIEITSSFGVVWLPPGFAVDGEDLIRAADEMLYKSKNGGRNRVESVDYEAPSSSVTSDG